MQIVEIAPLYNGAHRNQSTSSPLTEIPEGWAVVPDDMEIPSTFPFVDVVAEDGVVTSMTPGIVPEPEPMPDPVTTPPSNEVLSAQIQAVSDRQEFIEDCIAEMASLLYE